MKHALISLFGTRRDLGEITLSFGLLFFGWGGQIKFKYRNVGSLYYKK